MTQETAADVPFSLKETTDAAKPVAPTGDIQITQPIADAPAQDIMWMPVDMPSMGLAGYPAQLRVRKFGMPDLVRMGSAQKLNSYPMVVAAMGATLDGIDIKMLTHGDFDFLMYWHTVNSLPRTPVRVSWTSRYGYRNDLTVDKSTRKTVMIEDGDKVEALKKKGYDFSRVGDELWRIHMADLNKFQGPDNEFEFALATWVRVDNPLDVESKVAAIRSMKDSLDFYEGLDEWRTVANHGVNDTVKLKCQHFKPETAIENVGNALQMLDAQAMLGEFDIKFQEQTASLLQELAHLRKLESEGLLGTAEPQEEEITIPLDVTNFFPYALGIRA